MFTDYKPADFRALSLVYAVFVFAVSFMQIPPSPPTLNLDLVLHALLYYGFAFVLWAGFSDRKFLIAAFAYGIMMEIIQPSFGRTFDYFDMAANGIGILIYWKFFSAK